MKKTFAIIFLLVTSQQSFAQGSNSGGVGYLNFQNQDPFQLTSDECEILRDLGELEICKGHISAATLDHINYLLSQKANDLLAEANFISSSDTREASELVNKVPAIQLVSYKIFRIRQNMNSKDSNEPPKTLLSF